MRLSRREVGLGLLAMSVGGCANRHFSLFRPRDAPFFNPEGPSGPQGEQRRDPVPPSPPKLYGRGAINSISAGPDNGVSNLFAAAFAERRRHCNLNELAEITARPLPFPNTVFEGEGRESIWPERQGSTVVPLEARPINIGGHGSPGFLDIGIGQGWGWDTQTAILAGLDFPTDGIRRLGRGYSGDITIYSCCTGAEDYGAAFVWLFGKAANRRVRAFTGLMSVTGGRDPTIRLQRGGKWQSATPEMTAPPPAISAPTYKSPVDLPAIENFIARSLKTILPEVSRIDIEVVDNGRIIAGQLTGQAARSIYTAVLSSENLGTNGGYPAAPTAQMIVHAPGGKRTLTLLADTLWQSDNGVHFLADSDAKKLLLQAVQSARALRL
ncbi:MAG: hypothetical protein H0W74_06670 [Sphingosinicella sp.]|nr:hypothetical protein [Sphingosinicella sp.]